MPLFPSTSPSVPVRTFRSLVFDESLEVILESDLRKRGVCSDIAALGAVSGIDEDRFRDWLKGGAKGKYRIHSTLWVDTDAKILVLKGYELQSKGGGKTFLCSSAPEAPIHSYEYIFDNKKLITTFEYLYHMMTCV